MNDQMYEVQFVKSAVERKDPRMVGFLSFKMQNWEFLSFLTIFWQLSAIAQSETLEIDTDLLCKAISEPDFCIIVSDQQWNRSGTLCELHTVALTFKVFHQQIFFLDFAELSVWNTINENLISSRENSAARNWFVCVAKLTVIMTLNETISNLAAKAWIKKRWKALVTGPCPSIPKFWKKRLWQRQQIGISAQWNILWPHLSKQEDCHICLLN